MGRKEQVERAVTMSGPDYVPLVYFNRDRERSDVIVTDVVQHFGGPGKDRSEWGFTWEKKDGTMGQPIDPPLRSAADAFHLTAPPLRWSGRAGTARRSMSRYGSDRFHVAGLALSGFTVMCALRGFAETLQDLYEDRPAVERLAEVVFSFETSIIRRLPEAGFDAVGFFDDWGMQQGMIVSPSLWREFFKPLYAAQFAEAHEVGLRVYFHSCGYYYPIVPDLIEIGVDLLNLSQPNLYDIPQLGRDYGGQVCFVCPVSYQTTSISGTREEIFADVKQLLEHLGGYNGGLLGYIEEYESIGLSERNYQACVEAFTTLGRSQDSSSSIHTD